MDEKKSFIQDFKEKTKGMSLTGKLDYFWTYYRIPTIVVTFCICLLISLASGIIKNALTKPVLSIGAVSDIDLYYHDDLETLAQETFPDSTGYHKPQVISFYSPEDTRVMYASTQLMAYLSTEQLDCLICDRATLNYCVNSSIAVKFEDITDTSLGQKARDLGISNLYYVWLTDLGHAEAAEKFLGVIKTFEFK